MSNNSLFLKKVKETKASIKNVFLDNNYDWLVGFSGGKDSSVLVQIILESILEIDNNQRFKNIIHIVSSDTLIENPIALKQLNNSLSLIENFANINDLPVKVYKVQPDISDSFWVNLIGRGYPLPNQSFRWCTDRLKIKPMNKKMNEIRKNKEILTVLGVRKGESASRDIKLKKNDIENSDFKKNRTNNKLIYAPIEKFSLSDVWMYLAQSNLNFFKNNNNNLSILYEDSSFGTGECPSSLDDKLKRGCGNSRWGCWLCPVVTQDKSLQGFINSGQNWLKPLLDFRDDLIKERDLVENRYHASLRISKQSDKVSLIKYRFMNLSEKNGIYFLPKKIGRNEIIYGQINNEKTHLVSKDAKYKIISEEEYKKIVDSGKFNPYAENFSSAYEKYIIRLDKDKYSERLCVVGLGPYTIDYRISILNRLLVLQESVKKYDIKIISEKEVIKILGLIESVKEELYKNGYINSKNIKNIGGIKKNVHAFI